MQKLKFNDKLKASSTDALLKKLKALHAELAVLDQEFVDTRSLDSVRKDLISSSILLHKDRGVKAYAACCLADILRCYAPDAPYTQSQLRDIFQFFFTQLSSGLSKADAPYYNQYFHLLECLATVKSVVLICDLPNAEDLMKEVFKDFFALVRKDLLSKKVELFMGDILTAIIDECNSVPQSVLDILLAQFMDKNSTSAHSLAVRVCNETAQKLQRHVSSYFTDIILHHTPHATASDDEDNDAPSSSLNEKEIQTAHTLIKRLYTSCPSLLTSVIPQLEEELQTDNLFLRTVATRTIGEMLANPPLGGDMSLQSNYPGAYTQWLLRKNDKSSQIRLAWVESSKGLLFSPLPNIREMRETLESSYLAKLMDPDEKIRAAVCRLFRDVDYETALHHVSEGVLRGVGGRLADRKRTVRTEACTSLARLYSLAFPEIENNDPGAIEKFSWIPNELLSVMGSVGDARAEIEQVLAEYIFPLPSTSSTSTSMSNNNTNNNTTSTSTSTKNTRQSNKGSSSKDKDKEKGKEKATSDPKDSSTSSPTTPTDPEQWTERLLTTMIYLTDKSLVALMSISGLKAARPTVWDVFVDCCIINNGGTPAPGSTTTPETHTANRTKLRSLIGHLSQTFPDPSSASTDLQSFADLNDHKLYKILKSVMDPKKADVGSVGKGETEFFRRLESRDRSIKETMGIFLRRAELRLVNKSSIPTLLDRVGVSSSSSSGARSSLGRKSSLGTRYSLNPKNEKPTRSNLAARHAQMILETVAKWCPGMVCGEEVMRGVFGVLGVGGKKGKGKGKSRARSRSAELDDSQDENEDGDEGEDGAVEMGNDRVVDVALQMLAGVVVMKEREREKQKEKQKGKRKEGDKENEDDGVELDSTILHRIKTLALGPNFRHAKFAARILAFSGQGQDDEEKDDEEIMKEREENCVGVVEMIADSLPSVPSNRLVAHIAALGQFAKFCPDAFEAKSEAITSFLVKRLLMASNRGEEDDEGEEGENEGEENEEEWIDDDDLSDRARAKILALKCLRYRSLSHSGQEKALEIAAPVLKMLTTILEGGGSLVANGQGQENVKLLSRLRLQASVSLLHLSTVEIYANALALRFLRLALTVQDSCFEVRMRFLTKLVGLLQARKLPARYNVVPFLTAHDPEEDVKQMATSYVFACMKRLPAALRVQSIELVFIRLLHILAHHPDFATGQEELVDMAKYVQFYLDLVLNQENLSLLYHLASKGKTVRDSEGQTYSENLYVMCEVAQELIRNRAQQNSWNIPSYPGKLKLPSDILKPHPNAEVANKVAKQTYLPSEAVSWLAVISNPVKEKKERKAPAKRKAATSATGNGTNGHAKRRKKRRQSAHTDEDDDQATSDVDMVDANGHNTSSAGEEEEMVAKRENQAQARAKRREARAKRAETPASSDA